MSKWFAQLAVELHILGVQLSNHVIIWNYCPKMGAQLICPFIRPRKLPESPGVDQPADPHGWSDAALQNGISVRNISQPPPKRVC